MEILKPKLASCVHENKLKNNDYDSADSPAKNRQTIEMSMRHGADLTSS